MRIALFELFVDFGERSKPDMLHTSCARRALFMRNPFLENACVANENGRRSHPESDYVLAENNQSGYFEHETWKVLVIRPTNRVTVRMRFLSHFLARAGVVHTREHAGRLAARSPNVLET